MKKNLTIALALAVILSLLASVAALADATPSITAEFPEYAPTETVNLFGAGWQAQEAVRVFVNDNVGQSWSYATDVVAADDGTFTISFQLPDWFVATYFVTATSASGATATTTFADGNATVTGVVTDGTNPINGATVTCDTTSGCNANLSTTTNASGQYFFDGLAGHGPKLTFAGNGPTSLTLTASKTGYTSDSETITGVNNGNTKTQNFTLTLSCTPVSITGQPANAAKTVGDSVTFSVAASGDAPISYQWYKGSGQISGATSSSYTINSIVVTDAGSYHVVVSNTCGGSTATSNNATLAVSQANTTTTVTFEAGPYVYRGSAFTATAAVTGPGGLNQSLTVSYSGDCVNVTSANGCTATATFAGDTNYNGSSDAKSITITKADSTTTVAVSNATYDGSPHGGTASVTGAGGLNQGLTVSYSGRLATSYGPSTTAPTNASDYTASASFAGDGNHTGSSDSKDFSIGQASSSVAVNCPLTAQTYTGSAIEPCTASYSGAGGLSGSITPIYTDNVNVGTATVSASYGGDANHTSSSNSATFEISRAESTTTVTFEAGPYTYRGTAFTATAAATGVGGLNVPVTVVYSGDCLNVTSANGCTATATFGGDANHNGSADSKNITITKASSTTTLTFEAGPYVYRGTAFTASAVATGIGGLNESVNVVYSGDCLNVTSTDGCTATANFAGDQNHNGSTDSKSITITKAGSATAVTFEAAPYVYRGTPFTATAVATGVGGLNQSVNVVYGGDCTNVTSADGCTATATFAGDQNHNGSTDSKSITILKASSTTTVTFEADPYVYRGTAFTATAAATGAGGLNASLSVDYSGDCTNVTAADGCTATATYTGDQNHNGSTSSASITILKANSVTTVTFEADPYVYRGTAFTATANVIGINLSHSVNVVYSGDCTNVTAANGCTATATFAGDQNHNGSTDSKSITITKANASCTVTGYSVIFDNAAHTATGSCTGVLGENLTVLNLSGTNHTLVGTYSDTWHFNASSANYSNASGTVSDSIGAWTVNGFFQPVDGSWLNSQPHTTIYNTVKNGSTVPLKFEIFAGGTELTDLSAVKSLTSTNASCTTGAAEDAIETTATGGTVLRYDATSGQFIYNWKTPSTAGKCIQVTMTALDGSTIQALFKLK